MKIASAAVLTALSACRFADGAPGQFYQQGSFQLAGNALLTADGNTAIIFAAQPTVFTRSNGVWSQQGPLSANIDWTQARSFAISADGATLIVGMPLDNDGAGSASILVRNNGVWTEQGSKLMGTGSSSAQQGSSVAISNDGNTAAISAPYDNSVGGVWVFTRSNGVWTRQGGKLTGSGSASSHPVQGTALALSADGSTLVMTDAGDANDLGAAWVFARANGQWTQQSSKLTPSDATGLPQVGSSADISADGNTVVLGGPADNYATGAAWTFVKANGTWTQQGSKLVGGGASGQARQGSSVAISADGNIVLVGGPGDNNGAGALWAFSRANATWNLSGSKIIGTGTRGLGSSLALSADGTTVAAGGPVVMLFAASANPPPVTLTPTIDYGNSTGRLGYIAVAVNPPGASWTVTSNTAWLTVISPAVGTGNTSVAYSAAPNNSILSRAGSITVNGQTFTLIQGGVPPSFSVTPTDSTLLAAGGTVTLTITASAPDAPWTATTLIPWIAFTSTENGAGSGTLTVSVAANPLIARKASFTVAGILININQAGGSSITSISTAGKPWSIVNGPDGALWFTEQTNKIGRITTAGALTEYAISAPGVSTRGITAGPDGALWFTASSNNPNLGMIGRITTAGAITLYPLPTTAAKPIAMTGAADGALWFTEQSPSQIGRISTAGIITEFPLPTDIDGGPAGITSGPDQALWFTSGSYIGRFTTTSPGTVAQFQLSSIPSESIVTGPDGALWFGLLPGGGRSSGYCYDSGIGRITTGGRITLGSLPYPDHSSTLCHGNVGVTAGPDGALWVADNNRAIYRVTTGGVMTALYPADATFGITAGSDGALWFAQSNGVGKAPAPAAPSGLAFYPLNPCRVVDTRDPSFTGPFGPPTLGANATRQLPILSSSCGVSSAAQAYSLNITVVPPVPLTFLTVWPAGQPLPLVSTLNSYDGTVVANAAIVPADSTGEVNLYVSGPADVVVDIDGYFAPPGTQGLAFYPATPCRAADTRTGQPMSAAETRRFPISGVCNIPATAQAYSLNMTAAPAARLSYVSLWPAGKQQPFVSTLNSDGRIVANAAIVAAGTNGAVNVFTSDLTHVIIDVDGYFAPPGGPGALYFYPVTPCRTADTRSGEGYQAPYGPPSLATNSTRMFLMGGNCGLPPSAQAYSLNLTVVPLLTLGYLSVWPAGITQPYVSTLNSPLGRVVANAAIVPSGANGAISVFVTDPTDLVIDANGYFAH
ncbi:MAG TPA: BACON domain-containing carbohydrate-binding protein [Bryobacteraceae bacterium]|nr:BACON domain-containing carbohydrate-binding protein [Bryobacteraceae bacterium]